MKATLEIQKIYIFSKLFVQNHMLSIHLIVVHVLSYLSNKLGNYMLNLPQSIDFVFPFLGGWGLGGGVVIVLCFLGVFLQYIIFRDTSLPYGNIIQIFTGVEGHNAYKNFKGMKYCLTQISNKNT